MTRVYKILTDAEWAAARAAGAFKGSAVDVQDGYIHLSTGEQAAETARRHFAGRTDLMLLELEADDLGVELRWEPSRGGALFPHLYSPLPAGKVLSARPLALGPDGAPIIGDLA